MFIELVDDLRCPAAHEETWLVAAADLTHGRHIVEGTLGCPICHAEYRIRGGVASFGEVGRPTRHDGPGQPADAGEPVRLAAFLDLSDAQGFAILAGSFGRYAAALRAVAGTHLVLLNPAPEVPVGGGVSGVRAPQAIPFATGSCRGVALDDGHADAAHLDAAVRVLRPRGRLVAPATARLPAGVTALARDEHLWVAERAGGPGRLVVLQGKRNG